MKVNISFELDLTGTNYDILAEEDIGFAAQNIRDLFANIRVNALSNITEIMCRPDDDPSKQMTLMHYKDDAKITKDMFKTFTITGEFNGEKFTT